MTELKNRGVEDMFFVICDSLKGLPDSVGAVYGQAIVQTCVIHLIRNTFRYASKKYCGQIATDLKPIYGAPTREAAWRAFDGSLREMGQALPRDRWPVAIGVGAIHPTFGPDAGPQNL